jgi:hypothetical protein
MATPLYGNFYEGWGHKTGFANGTTLLSPLQDGWVLGCGEESSFASSFFFVITIFCIRSRIPACFGEKKNKKYK